MSNRRIDKIELNGTIYEVGVQPYRIETLSVKDGDVIILHLANDLDLDSVYSIQRDIQKDFPNNRVICANDNILKSITVLQSDTTFCGVDLSLDGEWMF